MVAYQLELQAMMNGMCCKREVMIINADSIMSIVSNTLGFPVAVLLGRDQTRPVSEARQIAILLIREYLNYNKSELGRLFGRDHSSIIFALNTASGLLEIYQPFIAKMNRVRMAMEGAAV